MQRQQQQQQQQHNDLATAAAAAEEHAAFDDDGFDSVGGIDFDASGGQGQLVGGLGSVWDDDCIGTGWVDVYTGAGDLGEVGCIVNHEAAVGAPSAFAADSDAHKEAAFDV